MLEAQRLTKYYNRKCAVQEVSFKIAPNDIVGYLGPNGAGKSTTVKMLVGLINPSSGRILFKGDPIEKQIIEFKAHLGYVPEDALLYSHLSGREYLQLAGRLRSMPENTLNAKIDELLRLFSLTASKHAPISSYSKGMKQKIMMMAAFLLVFTIAIDLCPTFLFPGAVLANNRFGREELGKTITLSFGIRYIVSHGISMLLGNVFIFLSAISLQGTLMALRVKPAISRWVRFFCLLLFLSALLSFTQISSVDQLIHTANPITVFYPPIWFVGVYDVLLETEDPLLWALAGRAVTGLAFACILSILSYAVCYRRFLNKTIESGSGHLQKTAGIRSLGNWMLDRWIIRSSESRASYHFVAQTLFRSASHTLYIGTFLAVGVAIAAIGLATVVVSSERAVISHLDSVLLSIPLILTFFLLVGMRVIFAIPVELEANWLFRIAPMRRIKSSHSGVRKYLIGAVILPVYCLAGLVYALVWSWGIVWLHVCFGVTVSCVLMELLLLRFPKIPFTCSYLSGTGQIVLMFPLYFLGFSCFAFGLANLGSWLAGHMYGMVCFYGVAGSALLLLLRYNNKSAATSIRFEETSEDALILLDLKS